MSYQALARKWRPKSFDQVIGQDHVVAALSNALESRRIHHAFLFTGTRGVGKTTLARIFARALNCETGITSSPCGECVACQGVEHGNYVDLIEVDAASRTRVDDTRELLDNVQYTPTQGRFKIYLIDEVHMLSTHSFNALLKTLEEPPEHVKFLLATTDPQKLPTTILSRCIQFNLRAMDIGLLVKQLAMIVEAEGIPFDESALLVLARSAEGSVRDALSLLDQAIAHGKGEIREDRLREMLGMIDDRFVLELLDRVCAADGPGVLDTIHRMAERSVDFAGATGELLTALHNTSLYQVNPQAVEWKGIDSSLFAGLAQSADAEMLQLYYQIALLGKRDMALAPDPRTGFEMTLLRMVAFHPGPPASPSASSPDKRQSRPSSAAASEAAPSPAPAPAAVAEKSPDDETSAGAAEAVEPKQNAPHRSIDLDVLASPAGWAAFVEQADLAGMAREMAMNMVPTACTENRLDLSLDPAREHLMDDKRVHRIEQYLAAAVDRPLTLSVTVGETGTANGKATPSQEQARRSEEKETAARQAFTNDPNVQELVDLFDAEIVTDSIRPGSD